MPATHPRARIAARLGVPLVAAALVASACSGSHKPAPSASLPPTPSPAPSASASPSPSTSPSASQTPSPSPTPAKTPATGAAPASCPSTYAPPDPHRPVVTLAFHYDGGVFVTGTEQVVFTPDKPVRDLVFRLWPNSPEFTKLGAAMSLQQVKVNGSPVAPVFSQSKTVATLPRTTTTPAGNAVTINLAFTLQLPKGAQPERLGSTPDVAWWGTGYPLLSWENGVGFATEPPLHQGFAEAVTSEAYRLADMTVTGPPGWKVLSSAIPSGNGHFSATAVRDVYVAIGKFTVASGTVRTAAGNVPVTVGVSPGSGYGAQDLLAHIEAVVPAHVARFGPFPFARLTIAAVPAIPGGIEYPGGFLFGPHQYDATPSHETAHQWFYGLVGDDQARDPWLDEAFAQYAEALARGTGDYYRGQSIPSVAKNRVGEPMTFWAPRRSAYYRGVYVQGASALLRARDAVGHAKFDHAIRCYVASQANKISTPRALEKALSGLPQAVSILRSVGALP